MPALISAHLGLEVAVVVGAQDVAESLQEECM